MASLPSKTQATNPIYLSIPTSLPADAITEEQLKRKIMELQKQMGIPTQDEYDPLAPGGTDQELWPAQPGELFTDFRIV